MTSLLCWFWASAASVPSGSGVNALHSFPTQPGRGGRFVCDCGCCDISHSHPRVHPGQRHHPLTQQPRGEDIARGFPLLLVLPPEPFVPERGVNLGGGADNELLMGDSALAKAELVQTPAPSTPVSPGDPDVPEPRSTLPSIQRVRGRVRSCLQSKPGVFVSAAGRASAGRAPAVPLLPAAGLGAGCGARLGPCLSIPPQSPHSIPCTQTSGGGGRIHPGLRRKAATHAPGGHGHAPLPAAEPAPR